MQIARNQSIGKLLIAAIMKLAISRELDLETATSVDGVEQRGSGKTMLRTTQTSRGSITIYSQPTATPLISFHKCKTSSFRCTGK